MFGLRSPNTGIYWVNEMCEKCRSGRVGLYFGIFSSSNRLLVVFRPFKLHDPIQFTRLSIIFSFFFVQIYALQPKKILWMGSSSNMIMIM